MWMWLKVKQRHKLNRPESTRHSWDPELTLVSSICRTEITQNSGHFIASMRTHQNWLWVSTNSKHRDNYSLQEYLMMASVAQVSGFPHFLNTPKLKQIRARGPWPLKHNHINNWEQRNSLILKILHSDKAGCWINKVGIAKIYHQFLWMPCICNREPKLMLI